MRKAKGKIAILVFAFIFWWNFPSPCVADSAQIKDVLDQLRFAELQIAAVTTDMYLYLGWAPDEKEGMKEASVRAIANLDQLRDQVMQQNFPEQAAPLKGLTLQMIAQLTTIYRGIENKETVQIKEEFSPFNDLYEKYAEGFKTLWQKSSGDAEPAQELNSFEEELRWFHDAKVKERYRQAVEQIKAKNYAVAYETLKDMPDAIQDGPASDLIKLRFSDTLMIDYEAVNIEGLDAAEKGLDLLTEIINSGRYSPVLYEAFYKWRTSEQQFNHGMSNMSAIPNKKYNEKRRQVIQTVKNYLSENSGDAWARTQLALLWDLPNIQRGGPYGNDNLIHWGILYADLKESKENES